MLKQTREKLWNKEAVEFFNLHELDSLFMLGLGLYWGEGSKYPNAFELTNSDLGVIKNWLKWLKMYLPDAGLRFTIFSHSDVSKEDAIEYWASQLEIDSPIKCYLAAPKSSKGTRNGKLPYGTFRVATKKGATEHLFKMKVWIDILSNK